MILVDSTATVRHQGQGQKCLALRIVQRPNFVTYMNVKNNCVRERKEDLVCLCC